MCSKLAQILLFLSEKLVLERLRWRCGQKPNPPLEFKKWLTRRVVGARLIDGESQDVLSCEHLLGFYCPVTSGYEVLKMSRRLHAGPQREHLVHGFGGRRQ